MQMASTPVAAPSFSALGWQEQRNRGIQRCGGVTYFVHLEIGWDLGCKTLDAGLALGKMSPPAIKCEENIMG